jgi:hypothetical protein
MAITFGLLSVAIFLTGALPGMPGRGESVSSQLRMLDLLSEGDIAAVKAKVEGPAVDVGIFGNSRSVQLTASDIGVSAPFFNYSVPGGSFRQSVNLIETLSRRSGLPNTVIISVDHFEMGFMGRAAFPSGWRRWLNAAEDVNWVARDAGPRLATQSLLDHIKGEWSAFASTWNIAKLQDRGRFLWRGPGEGGSSADSPWRGDGARILLVAANPDLSFAPKVPFVLHETYLKRDLKRAAELAHRDGARLIIYESPIDPASDAIYRPNPTPPARRLREIFLFQCGALELECYSSPQLGDPDGAARWSDCCHAPADVLGRFVASLLK